MAHHAQTLLSQSERALEGATRLFEGARERVKAKLADPTQAETGGHGFCQHARHGLAWWSATVKGLEELLQWARRLTAGDAFADQEQLILLAAFGESLAQLRGGMPMSQSEIVRPADFDIEQPELSRLLAGR